MRFIRFLAVTAFFISASHFVHAGSLEDSRAQLKSMQACQISLSNEDCNLDILDPNFRKLVEGLDQSRKALNELRGVTTTTLAGTHEFFTDTVSRGSSDIIKLMGGSIWSVTPYYSELGNQDVIGILTGQNTANLYIDGLTYYGELLKGNVNRSSGIVASVIDEKADGEFLELDDGTYLFFGSYEAYDTGWWLPPYQVLIDSTYMNMWNLENGKKVWIESFK